MPTPKELFDKFVDELNAHTGTAAGRTVLEVEAELQVVYDRVLQEAKASIDGMYADLKQGALREFERKLKSLLDEHKNAAAGQRTRKSGWPKRLGYAAASVTAAGLLWLAGGAIVGAYKAPDESFEKRLYRIEDPRLPAIIPVHDLDGGRMGDVTYVSGINGYGTEKDAAGLSPPLSKERKANVKGANAFTIDEKGVDGHGMRRHGSVRLYTWRNR
jgi:hypothetical protein